MWVHCSVNSEFFSYIFYSVRNFCSSSCGLFQLITITVTATENSEGLRSQIFPFFFLSSQSDDFVDLAVKEQLHHSSLTGGGRSQRQLWWNCPLRCWTRGTKPTLGSSWCCSRMRRGGAGPLVCVLTSNSSLSHPHHEQSKKKHNVESYPLFNWSVPVKFKPEIKLPFRYFQLEPLPKSVWESLGLDPMEWDLKKMLICLFERKLQQMNTKVSEFVFGGSVWKHKRVFFSIYSFQRLLNAMCQAMKGALGKGDFGVQREHRDVKEGLGTRVAVNQSSLHLQCAFLRWGRLAVMHT